MILFITNIGYILVLLIQFLIILRAMTIGQTLEANKFSGAIRSYLQ
jgi:hypothetical protein